jgi:hypothetical protein
MSVELALGACGYFACCRQGQRALEVSISAPLPGADAARCLFVVSFLGQSKKKCASAGDGVFQWVGVELLAGLLSRWEQ